MLIDELFESGDGVSRFALAVHGDELKHLAAENAAGFVNVLDCKLCAVLAGSAPQSGRAGKVGDVADLNSIGIRARSFGAVVRRGRSIGSSGVAAGNKRQNHYNSQKDGYRFFHVRSPCFWDVFGS